MTDKSTGRYLDGTPGKYYLWTAVPFAIGATVLEVVKAVVAMSAFVAPDQFHVLGDGILTAVIRLAWAVAGLMALMGVIQFHHACRAAYGGDSIET